MSFLRVDDGMAINVDRILTIEVEEVEQDDGSAWIVVANLERVGQSPDPFALTEPLDNQGAAEAVLTGLLNDLNAPVKTTLFQG